MSRHRKVIITCAVTGGAHTPTMSPYLPIRPEQIAAQAIEAAQAGASILHLHARDPKDGRPSASPEIFQEFLRPIKEATNAVVNITTGAGAGMSLEERSAAVRNLKPEMASLNMGSMNFGYYKLLDRYPEWKYDWERAAVANTRKWIFQNTFEDIEWLLENVGNRCGTRFEFECYDVGHLYTLAHFVDEGMVKPPLMIQTVFGVHGGIGAHAEDILHQRRTADRLFGKDYVWSILPIGRNQIPSGVFAALMGANVRVGLEDNLFIGRGELATSNSEQVRSMRTILESLGMEIAGPDDVHSILGLKGSKNVAF